MADPGTQYLSASFHVNDDRLAVDDLRDSPTLGDLNRLRWNSCHVFHINSLKRFTISILRGISLCLLRSAIFTPKFLSQTEISYKVCKFCKWRIYGRHLDKSKIAEIDFAIIQST